MHSLSLSCNTYVQRTSICMSVCAQVRSIMGQVRPDRQTLLFTATMPTKVDNLVRDCLTTPVRITVGEVGAANQDIQQVSARETQALQGHVARLTMVTTCSISEVYADFGSRELSWSILSTYSLAYFATELTKARQASRSVTYVCVWLYEQSRAYHL